MGIQGLLPLLKEIQVQRHVSDFKGQTLAIDAYVWLHRAAFSCAPSLIKSPSTLSPTKFVDYSMHRIRMLRYHGIEPFVVFDGGPLRAKGGTEVERARRRQDHLLRALAYEAQGRHKDARDCFTKCVDITPELALQLITALKADNVPYIVAPYEADAQLAYLEREGIVDGIITEDSDLLVFGCKSVVYRLDSNGDCMSISRERFPACREFSFTGWTDTEFRRMAIMAGCDYLDSIPGIGLKTAHRLLRKHKTVEKVVQNVKLEGSCIVPTDYIAQFRLAELVFLHQRVYDPRSKRLVTLLPLPERGLDEIECGYIGPDMTPEIAQGLAEGRLHPETKLPLKDQWPGYQPQGKGNVAIPVVESEVKHEGFYKPKTPLGSSSRQNTSGPLDSFFKRSPAALAKPTKPTSAPFVPAPVGTRTSGPARLSDLTAPPRNAEAGPSRIPAAVTMVLPEVATGDLKVSKFFSMPATRKRPLGRQEDERVDVEIEYEDCLLLPEPVRSLPIRVDDMDLETETGKSDDCLPSPVCSSVHSPTSNARHGSPMTSPGRSGDESGNISESEDRQQRSSSLNVVQHSPSDGRQRKRRKPSPLDDDTPALEGNMLAPSSETGDQPRTPEQPGHDLSAFCGVLADDNSSVHNDWSAHDVEVIEEDGVSSDEAERLEAAAKSAAKVAKGWRAKYSFGAKSSPFSPARLSLATPSGRTPLGHRNDNTPTATRPTPTRRGSSGLRMDPASTKKVSRTGMLMESMDDGCASSPIGTRDSSRPLMPMSAVMGGFGMGKMERPTENRSILVPESPTTPAIRESGGSRLQRFKFVPR